MHNARGCVIISFLRIGVKLCQICFVRIAISPLIQPSCLKHRIKRPKNVSCVAKASREVKRVSFAQMRVDVKPTNARKKLKRCLFSYGFKCSVSKTQNKRILNAKCLCGFYHLYNLRICSDVSRE